MPRNRFDRLAQARRDEILDAAARHFAASSFAEASYNQILEDAGLSKSSAYYLFESKADLYATVLERELSSLSSSLPLPLPPTDPSSFWSSVRDWLAAALSFLAAHPRTAALLSRYIESRQRSAVPDLDHAIEATFRSSLVAMLSAGQEVDAVRTDLDMTLLASLAGGALSILDRHFLVETPTTEGALSAEMDTTVLDLYLDTLQRLLTPSSSAAL